MKKLLAIMTLLIAMNTTTIFGSNINNNTEVIKDAFRLYVTYPFNL